MAITRSLIGEMFAQAHVEVRVMRPCRLLAPPPTDAAKALVHSLASLNNWMVGNPRGGVDLLVNPDLELAEVFPLKIACSIVAKLMGESVRHRLEGSTVCLPNGGERFPHQLRQQMLPAIFNGNTSATSRSGFTRRSTPPRGFPTIQLFSNPSECAWSFQRAVGIAGREPEQPARAALLELRHGPGQTFPDQRARRCHGVPHRCV